MSRTTKSLNSIRLSPTTALDHIDSIARKNGYAAHPHRRGVISNWLHTPSQIPHDGKEETRDIWRAEILSLLTESVGAKDVSGALDWDGVPFPPPQNPSFEFCDFFAGIGGFRLALQNLGGKCVFSSEIDNTARRTYLTNFGEEPYGDIRDIAAKESDEIAALVPDHDILCAGFPCQPFSRAGVSARIFYGIQHGLDCEDQGNLFFELMRIVAAKKPKVLFLENVRNLKIHDGGKTLAIIKKTIEGLGYSFSFKLLSSATKVPQNRVRCYMVCFLDYPEFEFPEFEGDVLPLESILEPDVPDVYTISDLLWDSHQKRSERNKERNTGFIVRLANTSKPSNTLVARYGKDGKECLIAQEGKNPRKLTPRECARLMGFPDKASGADRDYVLPPKRTTAYRQFGNSVVVPVIQSIAADILETLSQPPPPRQQTLFPPEEIVLLTE